MRKNINCKECGNTNPKGRSFCSDECAHTNYLKRMKVKREAKKHLRPLINGISKINEIKYYTDLVNRVTSYKELRQMDTMKHKRSYAWLVKYCKPKWILPIAERLNKTKEDAAIRNEQRVAELSKLPYINKVIRTYVTKDNGFKVECECTNGHILKRSPIVLLKDGECTICRGIQLKNEIKEKKELEAKLVKEQRIENITNKELERVKIVSDFIQSGDYVNYDSWKQTPIFNEYYWIRNGAGKKYLTNELRIEIDRIGYFEYMGAVRCPYPTKKGHRWCKHCKTQKSISEFRAKNICKQCAMEYRRENYYEKDNIQGRINYRTNPMSKLHTLVKVYVLSALKGKPKTLRTKDIIGIDWDEFRVYIENQFEPWMNWDNHGHGKGKWALQHIIPKTYAETEDDIYRLNYYRNLMPMDFSDNGALGDRILRYQLNEWHYDNCSDFLDKHKDSILESMDVIYNNK